MPTLYAAPIDSTAAAIARTLEMLGVPYVRRDPSADPPQRHSSARSRVAGPRSARKFTRRRSRARPTACARCSRRRPDP